MSLHDKVKISDIKEGPILHESFTVDFIQRIRKYKEVLTEVETTSVEETLISFQRDHNPERELILWEKIALIYENFTVTNPDLSVTERKDALNMLISLSMDLEDFSNIKNLSKEKIHELKQQIRA